MPEIGAPGMWLAVDYLPIWRFASVTPGGHIALSRVLTRPQRTDPALFDLSSPSAHNISPVAAHDDASKLRLRGRFGAYESWAKTEDRTARTWPARKAMLDRFEREVDPDGVLSPQERAKRAEWARKAYMHRLALKSAAARRRRKTICSLCGKAKEPEASRCAACLRKIREP